jgi:hypothetical protein
LNNNKIENKYMKIINKSFASFLVAFTVIAFGLVGTSPVRAQTSPDLGDADSYSVLAGSEVTNTSTATTMNFNLGISPSIGVPPHYSNFPPGVVGPPGVIHDADAHAALAQAANTALFTSIDQPCDTTYGGVQDLTLVSPLPAGVYCSTGSFILTGNLTLSGSGVWIFKSASTIITSPGSSVTGGDPCDIWWRAVSSVTLDTTTSFRGNVLALTAITMNTGATLAGRAMTQTAEVTLDDNVITTASCITPAAEEEEDEEELEDTGANTYLYLLAGTISVAGAYILFKLTRTKEKEL